MSSFLKLTPSALTAFIWNRLLNLLKKNTMFYTFIFKEKVSEAKDNTFYGTQYKYYSRMGLSL